jgi:hypothetical protein
MRVTDRLFMSGWGDVSQKRMELKQIGSATSREFIGKNCLQFPHQDTHAKRGLVRLLVVAR